MLAPCIGSLIGVLALRLPQGRAVLLARSCCDSCATKLRPRDLVPLLSYLARRGRCHACGAAIPVLLPVLEVAAIVVVLPVLLLAPQSSWAGGCVLAWQILALAVIDLRDFLLPWPLTLLLALTGLALDPDLLLDHAIGWGAGFAAFTALRLGYRRLRGQDGLGEGDAWLLGGLGAWLGWQALPDLVLLAAGAGLAVTVAVRLVHRRTLAAPLPVGPWLGLAGYAIWLWQAAD